VKLLVTGFEPLVCCPRTRSATIVGEFVTPSGRRDLTPIQCLRVAILPPSSRKPSVRLASLSSPILRMCCLPSVCARAEACDSSAPLVTATMPRYRHAGELRKLTPIVPGGPDTFESTLQSRLCRRRSTTRRAGSHLG